MVFFFEFAHVAQWIAHRTSNPGVPSSSLGVGELNAKRKDSERARNYSALIDGVQSFFFCPRNRKNLLFSTWADFRFQYVK